MSGGCGLIGSLRVSDGCHVQRRRARCRTWLPVGGRQLPAKGLTPMTRARAIPNQAAAFSEGAHARGRYRRPPAGGRQLSEKPSAFAYSVTTVRRRAASAIRKALVDAYIKCLLTLNLCLLYPIAEKVKLHRIGLATNARPNRIGMAATARSRRTGLAASARPHRIGMVWKAPDYLQKATYQIDLCINVD